jgi:hypothetical protein
LYPNALGKKGQQMASIGSQDSLRLAFGAHHAPVDAPAKLLRQIESEAQAIAVSIKASGFKLAVIAASIGKSEGYVSRLRSGQRPMPERLVGPFCAATGTNLLRQYIALRDALEQDEKRQVARLASMLRNVA